MVKIRTDVRDVSPIIQIIRNFLLGREHTTALRFSKDMASRSPPLPVLPDGPSHKLSNNYYYARDARREVAPPIVVAGSGAPKKQLADPAAVVPHEKLKTPGRVFLWD